ncbi:hypothetical protein EVAR_67358_1 [Eumeta japonica]|uniref:Secreted protein n=1 Tax=Eumeta variegata TaxID=151549 RepID=A0A4C2AGH9_EUMVA|nr:hypothetical protein EVAR_67358_1 [Eumeta japonica]
MVCALTCAPIRVTLLLISTSGPFSDYRRGSRGGGVCSVFKSTRIAYYNYQVTKFILNIKSGTYLKRMLDSETRTLNRSRCFSTGQGLRTTVGERQLSLLSEDGASD